MVDKIISTDKIEAEQEVQLYLNILDYQEKYEDVLTFLQSDVCLDKFPGAPISIKIEIYKKLKRWTELKDLSKLLLEEDPDRWDYYQDYLLSCFELANAGDKSIIDTCLNFINEVSMQTQLLVAYNAKMTFPCRFFKNQAIKNCVDHI